MPTDRALFWGVSRVAPAVKIGLNAAGAKRSEPENLGSNYLMKASVDGLIALADGRPNAAAHIWLAAAGETPLSAPLSAAANNNVGIAHLIRANRQEASRHLVLAQQHWALTRESIASLDAPIATRSSAFHLRLAIDHHEAFTGIRRRRLEELSAGAEAITAWNGQMALASEAGGNAMRADQSMIDALAAAYGPQCPDIQILSEPSMTDGVLKAYRSKADALTRSGPRLHLDSEGGAADIECAARITVLLHSGLLAGSPFNETGTTR